jgi:signal transduction histidine kinase
MVLAAILTLISFFRFREKHKALLEMINKITISQDNLPNPRNIIEEDYLKLIDVLYQEKCSIDSQKSLTISELNDYYTMWVHQIKTPISAIKLLFQSKDIHDIEIEQQLFRIEQYAEMALQYIRTESDAADFIIRKYSLDAIIRQAIRKYSKLFILKKITLDYVPAYVEVLTDEKWLLFVIEQILSNSLKYTQQGKISIYMENENDLTLVIEDTGIGIEPEDLPRICEKGYTGYNGRIDKKSTGIGLYLSKKILNRLSHKIYIQSFPNTGTKVLIDLSNNNQITD